MSGDHRVRAWRVAGAVVGTGHVDALSIGTVTGADLDTCAAEMCSRLPRGACPFGEYFLVATPVLRDAVPPHPDPAGGVLTCRVGVGHRRRGWSPHRWRRASDDARFVQDWLGQR